MERNVKSFLSVSLAAMGQPTSSSPIGTPLDLPLNVYIYDDVSDSIGVVDDSISFMEGNCGHFPCE